MDVLEKIETTEAEVDQYFTDRWKKKAKKILIKRENMGLDQYMYKRDQNGKVLEGRLDHEIDGYETEFIYWRKANHIHRWLVDNVQDGIDDCEEYPVSLEQMITFYDQLVQARLTRDASIFPPSEGFFFGSNSIDEYYWNEILETIRKLESDITIIKKLKETNQLDTYKNTFFYRASW